MKRKTGRIVMSFLLVLCMFYSMVATAIPALAADETTISNPYSSVNWNTYGQYKANLHSHTVESDGGNQPYEMIEDHYAKGYDIMAMTDHNVVNTTWDRTDTSKTYVTSERLAEINAGADRGSQGLIGIPYSDEQSLSDHLNTFWADFNNVSGATLESSIAMCESLGGISHINHPGRYTGGVSTANGGADGEAASSNPATVTKYVNLFNKYSSCVGMEIINKKDGDSFSDRILWDNILKQTMPGNPVWGFSNDDSHSTSAVGFSYNLMLMPENTLENVRYSMENGTFYAVAKVAYRELGSGFVSNGETPAITNITVDEVENTITIAGNYTNSIEWVADGVIIATGSTIDLNDYADQINNYVRAQLKGAGGIAFTQPFGVTGLDSVQDPTAPTVLVGVAPTSDANDDGQIANTTTAMEYKLATDPESSYTACSEAVTAGLAAGDYDVRYAAADGLNASPATTVTVPAYVAYATTDITFQPGADESSMNFTWYSNVMSSAVSVVQVALQSDMTDAEFPTASASDFTGSIADSDGFKSNEVSVTGLIPDTTYVYRLGDGTNFSQVYSFNTHNLTDGYNAILVGDPQIGSGGTLNGMTGWQNTVTQALTNFPSTSFILSAGDQVNSSTNKNEYTGFFSPAELTTMPVVPAVGNHDNGALYARHYNSPNESATYGTTDAGGDYWFTYGNTLYMVLNSNNQSATSHDVFMQQAISAAGPGIVWKIVMFHHSIYSSASHSTDSDILTRRSDLYPIFDKYDIDVALMGHDHVYTRTFQMEGGIPQNGVESAVTNPVGTLYITANSGSGSKYYDLQNADTGYMAVRWQGKVPSYSNIAVTGSSFTVTTYRTDTGAVIDTYTITKDQSGAPAGLVGVEPTTVDNADGKITDTTAAMEYKRTTQTTWTACTDTETTNLIPGVYDVRYAGPNPSVSTIVTVLPHGGVNQEQEAPTGLTSIDPTTADNNDGQIMGTTTAMEYRTSGGPVWNACTGASITGLAAGNYEVRYMARPGFMASPSAFISISAFDSGSGSAVTSRISNGNDDVEEPTAGGLPYFDSSDLEFMNDGSTNQIIGLRFLGIDIPAGATITGAYIQFSVDEVNNTDPCNIMIAAQKTANSQPFENVVQTVSGRTPTSAVAYWSSIPQWTVEHEAGLKERTPDLSALVQEVIDLDGWTPGNAISFGFAGEGVRIAESFEGAGSNLDQIPTLYITYEYIPPTGELVVPIGSALDDMEERPDKTLDWDSSDLEITRENAENNQQIGLRFDDLKIPQGAVITDAYIQFSVDETKTMDPFDVNIYTDNTVDSAPFENINGTVSSRMKSDSFVTWKDIAPWTVVHEAKALEATPDLSSLVQSIIDNDGWTPGNAISFILKGEGQRTAESFEGAGTNTDQIPTLHLSYTTNEKIVITARNTLVAEMESGKYTQASVSAAQLVVDEVDAAIQAGIDAAKRVALLAKMTGACEGLVLINQVKLEVAPNTILGSDRTITFRVSVDNLQGIDVMEGFIKITNSDFRILSISSLYSGAIFTPNPNYSGDGLTGYFSLAQIGGFADAAKMDVVDITIKLKNGMTAEALTAALDSITMYLGNSVTHTVTAVYCATVGDGKATTMIWTPSNVKGDISGDEDLTGRDLSIAMSFFGQTEAELGDLWFSKGVWQLDYNNNGGIDIGDLTAEACLIAKVPIV